MTMPALPDDWVDGETPLADEFNALKANIRSYYTPAWLDLNGLKAATADPGSCDITVALGNQTAFFTKFAWGGGALQNLHYKITVAGASLVTNQNLLAVYSLVGNKLGETAPQHGQWTIAGSKTTPLTAPLTLDPGIYWVMVLASGTTRPTFVLTAQSSDIGPLIRSGYLSGTVTSAPASFDPAALNRFYGILVGMS